MAVTADDHAVVLRLADGSTVGITHLGKGRDDFVRELRAARAAARRVALLQWAGSSPLDAFPAFAGDEPVTVNLFAEGLTVESDDGVPAFAPFPLVDDVVRQGYEFTVALRGGLDPIRFGRLGKRTDEFVADLAKARSALAAATVAGYAASQPPVSGLDAPDGWAVDRSRAGSAWPALRAAVAGHHRAAEVDTLERLAGDRLRLGLRVGGRERMPFALAPVGDRVAVEGTDTDSRATFVFATGDVDRLNAVLLLTNFRREAIALPDEELGRWSLAVRSLEVVRWARSALVARVVHDAGWEEKVTAALRG